MSSPSSYIDAAWRDHGAGTISDEHVAAPSRIAVYTPTSAAWHSPRSSHEMITSRASAGWPRRSASVGVASDTVTDAIRRTRPTGRVRPPRPSRAAATKREANVELGGIVSGWAKPPATISSLTMRPSAARYT